MPRATPEQSGIMAGTLRALRARLGYLPQHFGFYPKFTVRDYVEYIAWLRDENPD